MNALPPYVVRWHPPSGHLPTDAQDYVDHYPVKLLDGGVMELPLRALPGGTEAIALLMSNQTPFAVESALAPLLAQLARSWKPETIAAVPTMGLDYARLVARALGHPHYAALGLSRKFWYQDELAEVVSSSTSPDQVKNLYLDPALISRVAGRHVLLVDDVINTGVSALAAIRLLQRAGAHVEGLLVVLTEGHAWKETLRALGDGWPERVQAVGHIPLFSLTQDGRWKPIPGTM